jgi:hypothetical protein
MTVHWQVEPCPYQCLDEPLSITILVHHHLRLEQLLAGRWGIPRKRLLDDDDEWPEGAAKVSIITIELGI